MPRPADPHARAALVSAARAEFARKGLRGARIEDITTACGLSKGAFYLHFPSKEALFGEVVGELEAKLEALKAGRMEAVERFFQERGERLQRLFQLELSHDLEALELVWAYRDVFSVLVSGSQGTGFEGVLWRMTDSHVERVARDFRRLQDAGAVDRDMSPELFGSVIVGAFLLLSQQMARMRDKPDLAAWAQTLQRLCEQGTMPHSGAPALAAAARAARPSHSTRRRPARAKTRHTPRKHP